jgi:hypothetical protein
MADSALPPTSRVPLSPEASAWVAIVVAFGIFCTIVLAAGLAVHRHYQEATVPLGGALLRSHVNAGVALQSRGQLVGTSLERLPAENDPCPGEADICSPVNEGDSITTKPEAGYGPVASLVLPDGSQIDYFAHPAGGDFALDAYRVSAWTTERQEVRLRHSAGYARYDIAAGQPFTDVQYVVDLDDGTHVVLMPGGSYSINVPKAPDGRLPPTTTAGAPLYAEVAVRAAGRALVRRAGVDMPVGADERVQIPVDGTVSTAMPATWQLIRDADFAMFDAQNAYRDGSLTWQRSWNWDVPNMAPEEMNGRFAVIRGCRPETPDLCTAADQMLIGQFRRDGGQTRPFTVGIEQTLDVDVSEYSSLRLTGWVRVLTQTVARAGIAGSECPMLVQLVYKLTSPTDPQENRYFCVYTADDQPDAVPEEVGQIRYRPVPLFQWYQLDVELRDDSLIRQARFIQQIRIEARGHDYLVEFTGLGLMGRP